MLVTVESLTVGALKWNVVFAGCGIISAVSVFSGYIWEAELSSALVALPRGQVGPSHPNLLGFRAKLGLKNYGLGG
jgi:hypothetical protein